MRLINELLARQANQEDSCTGKFWEARFKSQALCNDKAIPSCLAYVDLNPVRASIAKTPEASEYTSIKKRIETAKSGTTQPDSLAKFVGNPREAMPTGLPSHLKDYLELVDWTGRIIRDDRREAIDEALPPILERLDIESQQWLYMATQFESRFKTFVGAAYELKKAAERTGYQRTPGLANCRAAFG